MRRQPTDRDCLRAAERALAMHRATRPATIGEAHAIAEDFREAGASLRRVAARLRAEQPRLALSTHAAFGSATFAAAHALVCQAEAAHVEHYATAWEQIASDPAGAWRATETELDARVMHYRDRIAARDAARPPEASS